MGVGIKSKERALVRGLGAAGSPWGVLAGGLKASKREGLTWREHCGEVARPGWGRRDRAEDSRQGGWAEGVDGSAG